MSEYEEQRAKETCKKYGIAMKVGKPVYDYPVWDEKDRHYIFPVTLRKGGKSMRIHFGQSRAAGDKAPTKYDVLACLTKFDPGSFENFCEEVGYDSDSRKAEKTYKAVKREWESVKRVFGEGECLDALREII
jgi:hypothetical protein